ncbi:MAG: polysaccharide deacetylase family protein [Marivibrio sp.]|uniref:polysaccharide deacetylase family protein n=1 Tax=Marivibrio sp. TaxID=2039719 RepID=UPI0032EB61FF
MQAAAARRQSDHVDPAADPWDRLRQVFDRYAAAGRTATFWRRDDDLRVAGPALDRLLALADGGPVTLAAIPRDLDAAAAARLDATAGVTLAPHGWAHANHAPEGEKKAEFGAHRPVEAMLAEIAAAWRRLRTLAPTAARPIFVPPWNRIDARLAARLPEAGLAALSTVKPRTPAERGRRLNVHVDPIDWKAGKRFLGDAPALEQAIGHLTARLDPEFPGDPQEPTGLLTHHPVHDGACWRFLERLHRAVADHPAARFVDAEQGLEP